MSKLFVEDTSLAAIGDAIREKTGKTDLMKLADMPNEIAAIETGDSYYDTFWDTFQQNGERTDYSYAFRYSTWDINTFKPKYFIKVTNGEGMFNESTLEGDLREILKACGSRLDTSECTRLNTMFRRSKFTALPTISAEGAINGMPNAFGECLSLATIEKIKTLSTISYANTFKSCLALENITFEGEIGQSISFAQSPLLSDASVQSIINCLVDLTGENAQTLTLHADVKAKLTEEQITAITSKNWTLA